MKDAADFQPSTIDNLHSGDPDMTLSSPKLIWRIQSSHLSAAFTGTLTAATRTSDSRSGRVLRPRGSLPFSSSPTHLVAPPEFPYLGTWFWVKRCSNDRPKSPAQGRPCFIRTIPVRTSCYPPPRPEKFGYLDRKVSSRDVSKGVARPSSARERNHHRIFFLYFPVWFTLRMPSMQKVGWCSFPVRWFQPNFPIF